MVNIVDFEPEGYGSSEKSIGGFRFIDSNHWGMSWRILIHYLTHEKDVIFHSNIVEPIDIEW